MEEHRGSDKKDRCERGVERTRWIELSLRVCTHLRVPVKAGGDEDDVGFECGERRKGGGQQLAPPRAGAALTDAQPNIAHAR